MKFIGDVHGHTDRLARMLKPEFQYMQLGDMALGFKNVFLPKYDNLTFVRGNHDSPEACRQHPCYAGEFGMKNGVFVISGAFSIDYEIRHRYMAMGSAPCWWADEELSMEQLSEAIALYTRLKPRVVASHEAPASISLKLLMSLGFRPEKKGSAQSRTALAMQVMFEAHQPERWVFGHYHANWVTKVGATTFQCLDELAVSEDITV
jgi:hypothetical protein